MRKQWEQFETLDVYWVLQKQASNVKRPYYFSDFNFSVTLISTETLYRHSSTLIICEGNIHHSKTSRDKISLSYFNFVIRSYSPSIQPKFSDFFLIDITLIRIIKNE